MAWCITNTTSETKSDIDADTDSKTDGVCTVAVSNLKLSDSGGRRAFFFGGGHCVNANTTVPHQSGKLNKVCEEATFFPAFLPYLFPLPLVFILTLIQLQFFTSWT